MVSDLQVGTNPGEDFWCEEMSQILSNLHTQIRLEALSVT